MKKLKQLLEGYAWERVPGKPLPTLKGVTAAYGGTNQVNEAVNTNRVSIPIGGINGKFLVITTSENDNTVIFKPDMSEPYDTLQNLDREYIQDELHAYCEKKTGLKFTTSGGGGTRQYRFKIDMYSIADKITNS
jgi:hypothetical protein